MESKFSLCSRFTFYNKQVTTLGGLQVKVVGPQTISGFTTTSSVTLHDNELLRSNKVTLSVGGKTKLLVENKSLIFCFLYTICDEVIRTRYLFCVSFTSSVQSVNLPDSHVKKSHETLFTG